MLKVLLEPKYTDLDGVAHGFENVFGRLFPVVGLSDKVKLEANFGIYAENKPFLWKAEDGLR